MSAKAASSILRSRALRSRYPHARLIKVDVSRARALAGVAAVLTADDIPGRKDSGVHEIDWPVLCYDKVRYVGDAIALVAAEREEIAEAALKLIEVEYEPLPVVSDPKQAAQSRKRFLGEVAGTGTFVLPIHFPHPTTGRVEADGERFRYAFVR